MFDRKRINDSKNSSVSNVTSFVPTLFLFRSHERIPCIRASFCGRDVRTRAREMLWRIHRKNVAKMRDLPWTNEDRIVVITRKPWGQWEGVEWETAMSGSIEKACKRWKAVKFHSSIRLRIPLPLVEGRLYADFAAFEHRTEKSFTTDREDWFGFAF